MNDLVSCYNSTLASALDRYAPLITKTIPARPLVPWFNDDIKEYPQFDDKIAWFSNFFV